MRTLVLCCLIALGGAGWLGAQSQEFTIALPDIEGRISLGVFDESGKLVRTLNVGATEKDFVIELNGLMSKWDGKDDAGTAMPAGKYFIRGYMVGNEVKAEGEAFHFNDWIVGEDSPAIRWIEDFDWLPDGKVIAVADSTGGNEAIVFQYQDEAGILWQQKMRGILSDNPLSKVDGAEVSTQLFSNDITRALISTSSERTIVLAGNNLFQFDLKSGSQLNRAPFTAAPPTCMTIEGDELFVGSAAGMAKLRVSDLTEIGAEKTPMRFDALAAENGKLIAGSREKAGVWIGEKGNWRALEIPAFASSVDFGNGETFWMTGKSVEDGKAFAGQFAPDGEFLRSYRGELEPRIVRAGRTAEQIAILEESATTQHLAALKMTGTSGWEIVFEKTIERCERFGLKDGKLVADAGETAPANEVSLELATGGLSTTAATAKVTAAQEADGLWLKSKAGLKILRISERPGITRIALQKVPAGLQIFAGDGAVVAEYTVGGISQIAEIDAGEVDLP